MEQQKRIILKLKGLQKSFGNHKVLRGVTLSLNESDFVLLLGANGAGKSTLLRICVGLSRADCGEVCFSSFKGNGLTPGLIAHAGHSLFLYKPLTVRENLELFATVNGSSLDIDGYLDEWKLKAHQDKKISELSKGLQYRVSVCRAFVGQPKYIFLDEPTSALDDASTQLVLARAKGILNSAGEKGFVIIATHDVERLRDYASRIIVLDNGVVALDSLRLAALRPELTNEELKQCVIEQYRKANR